MATEGNAIVCTNKSGTPTTFTVKRKGNASPPAGAASTTAASTTSASSNGATLVNGAASSPPPAAAKSAAAPAAEKSAATADAVAKAKAAAATAIKAINPHAKVIANIFSDLPAVNEAVKAFNIALAAYNKSSGLSQIKPLDEVVTEANSKEVRTAAAAAVDNIQKVERNGTLLGGRRKTHRKKHEKTCGKRSKTHKKHHKKHGKRSKTHKKRHHKKH